MIGHVIAGSEEVWEQDFLETEDKMSLGGKQ